MPEGLTFLPDFCDIPAIDAAGFGCVRVPERKLPLPSGVSGSTSLQTAYLLLTAHLGIPVAGQIWQVKLWLQLDCSSLHKWPGNDAA